MSHHLKKSELEIRKIYKIHSRNLYIGVWNGYSFTGIRRKFDSEYLDSEDHWDECSDCGKFRGTAKPLKDLGIRIPDWMSLEEGFSKDSITKRPVKYVENKGWYFIDTELFWKKITPVWVDNKKLSKFLKPIEAKVRLEVEEEFRKMSAQMNMLKLANESSEFSTKW